MTSRTSIDRPGILPLLACLAAIGFAGCAEGESSDAPDPDDQTAVLTDDASDDATERPEAVPDAEPDPGTDASAVVPIGTTLTFRVDETVSTESHDVGDTFTATLGSDLTAPDGTLIMAEGARSRWVVTRSSDEAGEQGEALLAFGLETLEVDGEWRPVEATVTSTELREDERDSGTETAAKVAVGAAAGAIVGQILGRDTESTLKGAGVGAAVGTIVALTTRDGHAELPAGSTLTVRLDEPIGR